MRRGYSWLLLSILISVFPGCAYKHRVLYKPGDVDISGQPTLEAVSQTVSKVFMSRGWKVTKEEPGVTEAEISRPDYSAQVRVSYDTKTAKIEYLSSANLKYRAQAGEERIHSRYNKLIRNIERDLNLVLAASR